MAVNSPAVNLMLEEASWILNMSHPIKPREMRRHFGATPYVMGIIWKALVRLRLLHDHHRPKHLVWTLYSVKEYPTTSHLERDLGVNRKTIAKYVYPLRRAFLKLIPVFVCWKNRLQDGRALRRICNVTVDGVDMRIEEPPKKDFSTDLPYDKKWYSHKFHGPGLRYELAVAIQTGDIVHINGPFPCGKYPDINIFRMGLKQKLEKAGEKAVADRGYQGEFRCRTPDDWVTLSNKNAMKTARARHEAINKWIKNFRAMSQVFRHDYKIHKEFFAVAVVVTQVEIAIHGPPWNVSF